MAQESWNSDNETGIQQPEVPVLCANNCGFFGSVTNNNLCSKCYRDYLLQQQMSASAAAPVPAGKAPATDESSSSTLVLGPPKTTAGAAEPVAEEKQPEDTPKPPANRCLLCRKKVGLTGFQCRCGGTFCSSHRYSDAHECSFDYKKSGREMIAKQNPVVMANKIDKI